MTIQRPKCPYCNSTHITKHGFAWSGGKKVQRYQCQGCGKTFQIKEE